MKNKKFYEVPGITVIRMDAHSDIIQTSPAGVASLSGYNTETAQILNAVNANQLEG